MNLILYLTSIILMIIFPYGLLMEKVANCWNNEKGLWSDDINIMTRRTLSKQFWKILSNISWTRLWRDSMRIGEVSVYLYWTDLDHSSCVPLLEMKSFAVFVKSISTDRNRYFWFSALATCTCNRFHLPSVVLGLSSGFRCFIIFMIYDYGRSLQPPLLLPRNEKEDDML